MVKSPEALSTADTPHLDLAIQAAWYSIQGNTVALLQYRAMGRPTSLKYMYSSYLPATAATSWPVTCRICLEGLLLSVLYARCSWALLGDRSTPHRYSSSHTTMTCV